MSRGLIYGGRRKFPRREDRELIPFPNAVPGVYEQITGTSLSPFGGLLIDALLNQVAQAMADLVTIYGATNFQEPLRPLPWAEVKLGVFQRAATVIRTSNGIEYRRLYIRRGDVRAAATVLKKSGVRFASIEEILATSEASIGPAVGGETEAGVV
jgi:hypothetical protein